MIKFSFRMVGIFLIVLSVVFLVAAVVSLFYNCVSDPYQYASIGDDIYGVHVNPYTFNHPRLRDSPPEYHPDAASSSANPDLPLPPDRIFPHQWLTLPSATIGIIALVSGVYLYRKGVYTRERTSKDRKRLSYWSAKK